jgi:hypothetical protein
MLTPEDSRVTFQAFPGEEVNITGGVPLNGLNWTAEVPPVREAYEYRPGSLSDGFDIAPQGSYTIAQAQALCNSIPACVGFTFTGSGPSPSGPVPCAFKYNAFWSSSGNNQGTYVKNSGYVPGAPKALFSAPVSGFDDITALRVAGVRMIRARYPNWPTVELMGAMQVRACVCVCVYMCVRARVRACVCLSARAPSACKRGLSAVCAYAVPRVYSVPRLPTATPPRPLQIDANGWTQQPMGTNANYTFQPAVPFRNDSAQGYFQNFKLGVGA